MGLVEKDTARLTEASREGSEQRKRPTRKILVHERRDTGVPCTLLGDEDGNEEERRGNKENVGLRNLRFHLVARACPSVLSSWLVNRGRGPRETRPPAGRVDPPPPPQPPHRRRCARTRSEWGPQKMHPRTQPLSRRAHFYGILALCFSTSVILTDDYIVGTLAGPQPRM